MNRMPITSAPRTDLLNVLAYHLLEGKLGHKEFFFGFFNSGFPQDLRYWEFARLRNCNRAGCGLGECPFVFPSWSFNYEHQPVSAEAEHSTSLSAGLFFSLTQIQYEHLFVPDRQIPEIYGGQRLNKYASSKQLAENIFSFCKVIKS